MGIGHVREELADSSVRFLQIFYYLIVYRFERRPIEIARVLSHYRDIAELLR